MTIPEMSAAEAAEIIRTTQVERPPLTVTKAREIARRARRHGHFDTGRILWVFCPECGARVERDKTAWEPVVHQLNAAMLYHLIEGDCPGAPQ